MDYNTGYPKYLKKLKGEDCKDELVEAVHAHCNEILARYASIPNNEIAINIGTAQAKNFFVLLDYEQLIIDADDVFAISYMPDTRLENEKKRNEQFTLCVFFTRDEYIPVFGAVYVERLSIFDRIRKIRRLDFVNELTQLCQNLKYPILEVNEMLQLLHSENGMRERFNKNYMYEELDDAQNQIGIFDSKKMSCQIGLLAGKQLASHGFIWGQT